MNQRNKRRAHSTMPYLQFTHRRLAYTIDYCKKYNPEDPPADIDKLPELDLNFTERKHERLWRIFVDPTFLRFTFLGTNIVSAINILFTILLAIVFMSGWIYTYRVIADLTPELTRNVIIAWGVTGGVWFISTALHLSIRLVKGVILFHHKDYTIKGDYVELFITPRREGILNIKVDGREMKYIYRKRKKERIEVSTEQTV